MEEKIVTLGPRNAFHKMPPHGIFGLILSPRKAFSVKGGPVLDQDFSYLLGLNVNSCKIKTEKMYPDPDVRS